MLHMPNSWRRLVGTKLRTLQFPKRFGVGPIWIKYSLERCSLIEISRCEIGLRWRFENMFKSAEWGIHSLSMSDSGTKLTNTRPMLTSALGCIPDLCRNSGQDR